MIKFWCHCCQKYIIFRNRSNLKCQICKSQAIEEISQNLCNDPSRFIPPQVSLNGQLNTTNQISSNSNSISINSSTSVDQQRERLRSLLLRNLLLQSVLRPNFSIIQLVFMDNEEEQNQGVDEQLINKLENTKLSQDCTICQQNSGQGVILGCKHQFHKQCITPWLKNHNTCPCCRSKVQA